MPSDQFQIALLADHPQYIPTLVGGLIAAWREPDTFDRHEARIRKLNTHLNRTSLPLALVGHDGSNPLGIVCLRETDLDGYHQLGPWLGGLFVFPEARKRGIGSQLCAAAEHQALKLGISQLYLFTLDQGNIYRRLGWHIHGTATWTGRSGEILHRDLLGAAL